MLARVILLCDVNCVDKLGLNSAKGNCAKRFHGQAILIGLLLFRGAVHTAVISALAHLSYKAYVFCLNEL